MKIKTRMSNEERRSCIYCGKVRTLSNEHVFPAGLGGDDHRFMLRELVCTVCNTETFSPLELRFSRSSPAALGRGAFDSRAFFQLDAFKPDKTLPCGPK